MVQKGTVLRVRSCLKLIFKKSILSDRRTVPSIPPGHCGHQERERVPESGSSSSLTFVMA
jgi:hypothetical protein